MVFESQEKEQKNTAEKNGVKTKSGMVLTLNL